MPTRDDYERLILHSLKPGDKVRVPMKDLQEYNSQRMVLFRLMQSLKATAHDVSLITSRKVADDNDNLYLEIEHQSNDDPVFLFQTDEGFKPRKVSRELGTREDDSFEKWMQEVRQLAKEEEDGKGNNNER